MNPKYQNIGDPKDKVVEESAELIKELTTLIQEICKAKHFGVFSSNPVDQPYKPNIIRILEEMDDVSIASAKLKDLFLQSIEDYPDLMDMYNSSFLLKDEYSDKPVGRDFRLDVCGNQIFTDDPVAIIYPESHSMRMGFARKLTPKGITVGIKLNDDPDCEENMVPRRLDQVVKVLNSNT